MRVVAVEGDEKLDQVRDVYGGCRLAYRMHAELWRADVDRGDRQFARYQRADRRAARTSVLHHVVLYGHVGQPGRLAHNAR